jgi:hypothetical protein
MAYLPPRYAKTNIKFNLSDFDNNINDFLEFDDRYIKLTGINYILSKNLFYGVNTFINNFNSFVYLTIKKTLNVSYNILTDKLQCLNIMSDKIKCNDITIKTINNKEILNIACYIYIDNIPYPIYKTINNISQSYLELNNNMFMLIYPYYSIYFYNEKNILMFQYENNDNEIKKVNVIFKYSNMLCEKIKIKYKNFNIL